jgi:hypothetical protein
LHILFYRYTGFYKGIQSAGAAVAWQIDNHNVSPMSQLIVNWVLTTVSYPLLLVLMVLAVKEDNNNNKEEKEFHVENISPPMHNGSVDC